MPLWNVTCMSFKRILHVYFIPFVSKQVMMTGRVQTRLGLLMILSMEYLVISLGVVQSLTHLREALIESRSLMTDLIRVLNLMLGIDLGFSMV